MDLRHDVTVGSDDTPFRLIEVCMFGSVDRISGLLCAHRKGALAGGGVGHPFVLGLTKESKKFNYERA